MGLIIILLIFLDRRKVKTAITVYEALDFKLMFLWIILGKYDILINVAYDFG